MSNIAINPETGEAVQWDGKDWKPLQTARNPQTGELRALMGDKWEPLDMPSDRSTGEQVVRGARAFGTGFNNSVGAAMGAIPDAVGWGLRQIGLPSSEPGQYTRFFQNSLNSVGNALDGGVQPENRIERNLMATGEGVGNAASVLAPAGAVSALARGGSMASNIAGQLASNPVTQLVAGGVGGSVAQATDSPAKGMAAALAVPLGASLVRGAISPGAMRPNPESQRLVEVAQAEGIPLSPGQLTGSRPMRTAESVFATLPTTAGRQEAFNQSQREAFNRAVMGRAGVSGENLATPEVLQATSNRIGGELGAIASRNTMQVDATAMQAVQQQARDARRYLTSDQAGPVMNRIEDFINKIRIGPNNTATVEGEAFANLDSALSRHIRGVSDGNARDALRSLRDTLRRAMDASISADDAAAWSEARRQYANYKTIEAAMNQPGAATAAGNIPPTSLSQALARGPQHNYAMGYGDLNDLSRVGRAFVQDVVPNSGSPERAHIINLLTGGVGGLGASAAGGGMEAAALGTAAALAGPRVAQEVYMSPIMRAYLTNQIANDILPTMTRGSVTGIGAAQTRSMLEGRR